MMDILNFYLQTPIKQIEHIRIKLSDIPDEVVKEYKLRGMATKDNSIYIEASRGMYGLPQLGLLVNELLEEQLIPTEQVGAGTMETQLATSAIHAGGR